MTIIFKNDNSGSQVLQLNDKAISNFLNSLPSVSTLREAGMNALTRLFHTDKKAAIKKYKQLDENVRIGLHAIDIMVDLNYSSYELLQKQID